MKTPQLKKGTLGTLSCLGSKSCIFIGQEVFGGVQNSDAHRETNMSIPTFNEQFHNRNGKCVWQAINHLYKQRKDDTEGQIKTNIDRF